MSYSIGIIGATSDSPFHTPFIEAIAQEIARIGARLVYVQGTPAWMLRTGIAHTLADAWIVINLTDGARQLAALGSPVLLVAGESGDLPRVQSDNRSGTLAAIQHLISQGHTRIAFIGTLVNLDFCERLDAYREQLDANGIAFDPRLVIEPRGYDMFDCQDAMAALLARGVVPTAVFGANDWAAMGAIQAIEATGRRVPHDIAVVGFDDIPEAAHASPPLSSVRQRSDELGRVALQLVLTQLRDGTPPPAMTRIATQFVARASSGARGRGEAGDLASRYRGANWRTALLADLVQIALPPPAPGVRVTPSEMWPGVEQLVDAIEDAARGARATALPAALWNTLRRSRAITDFQPQLDQLRAAAYQRAAVYATPDATEAVANLLLTCQDAIMRHTTAVYADQIASHTRAAISETALLRHFNSSDRSPRQLDWAEVSLVDWATIGLLGPDTSISPAQTEVAVPAVFERGRGTRQVQQHVPVRAFPPRDLVPAHIGDSPDYILKISALRTPAREWGYVATYERFFSAGYDLIDSRNAYIATLLEREELLRSLHEQSIRDSLTGLYNRRYMTEQLNAGFASAWRSGHPLSLAALDLDHFKRINDTLLHAGGDRVLETIAAILRRETRPGDTVARIGGEEFVILMPDTPLAGAAQACERLRIAVERHPWHEVGRALQVTVSIGVACSASCDSTDDLLRTSDARLYAAKAGGRNRVVASSALA